MWFFIVFLKMFATFDLQVGQQSALAAANNPGNAPTIGAGFSGSPITPVEA